VVPSATAFAVHPVAGSQVSVVQRFPSSQLIGFAPTQTPPSQESFCVQTVPSEQFVPSAAF
jgi:hypothetical protein